MKSENDVDPPTQGQIVLYQTEDGRARLECRFQDESIWLTQRLIAELFQIRIPTVNEHLSNIYAEGELTSEATIRKYLIVRTEGSREVSRWVDHYNLEAILAVGLVHLPRVEAHQVGVVDERRINAKVQVGVQAHQDRLHAQRLGVQRKQPLVALSARMCIRHCLAEADLKLKRLGVELRLDFSDGFGG